MITYYNCDDLDCYTTNGSNIDPNEWRHFGRGGGVLADHGSGWGDGNGQGNELCCYAGNGDGKGRGDYHEHYGNSDGNGNGFGGAPRRDGTNEIDFATQELDIFIVWAISGELSR